MRKLKLFFACLLMAVLSIGQVWAVDYDLVYTLDGTITTGGNSNYEQDGGGLTQNSIGWSVTGNTTINPWRIGGKNITAVNRLVYSKTKIEDNVAKIEIEHGDMNLQSVNSVTVEVASNSDFSTVVATFTPTFEANKKVTILRESGDWSNCFYRITYNVTQATNSNKYLQLKSVKFYKEQAASDVATPTFSPEAGVYTSAQSVTLSCETASSTIYYTTDGSDPDNTKTQYTGAINVSETQTIKAIAYVGSAVSNVASATYTIVTPLSTMDAIFAAATAAGSTATDVYIDFQNWVVSGVKSSTAYVTDGTKGFIVYYSGHGFAEGDILSGIGSFKIKLYNGAAELTAKNSGTITITKGGTAQLNELDAEGIAALSGVNTGSLIKVSGACTSESSKYYIAGVQLYTTLYTYTNPTAGKNYNCTGVYVQYNSTKEMMPRKAADIEEVVTKYTVAYDASPANGSLAIYDGSNLITSGSKVNENTVLTITTTPEEDYKLAGVTVNGSAYTELTLTLTEDVTIAASFEEDTADPVNSYVLSVLGTEIPQSVSGLKVGDKVNLPSTATACSKTFVGWTTKADFADGDELLESYYAAGAEYTLEANNLLYAVYADAHVVTPTDHALGSLTVGGTSGNTASEGYTYTSNKTNDKSGYTQDSGTKDADIVHLQIKAESQIINEEPSAIIVTAHLGAGADRETLTYPVNAVLVDADGNNVGAPVVLTNSIPDKNGDDFSANLPTANYADVRGVKISHMKEDGWNVRYYSMSFKYQTGGTTYSNYSTDCQAAVATPTFSPAAGTYTAVQNVTISSETTGATIYYTTNGDDPTTSSTLYNGAVEVGESMTLKAIAVKSGMADSEIASATYTINLPLSTMDQIFAAATAAGGTATDANIAFGNWVVSGVSTNGKNVFVTDGTKGFIIFDNGGEMGFAVGDVLSGTVACKVQLYKGAAELTTLSSTTEGLNIAKEGVITPVVKAITALSGVNTGAPVIINSVQFDGTNLSDGANNIKPYNSLFAYDELENGKYYNVTGIYVQYDPDKEILPRSAADIDEVDLSDPEISYTPASATIELGEDLPAMVFANPHDLAISYNSNNEAVATVSNIGVIALGTATGTAVITASFAGDATYAAGNATYTITVNPAAVTENVVILAQYDTKYYAMPTAVNTSGACEAIAVEYDGSQVTVASAEDKAAIQWTRKTSGDNTTFQNASSKYLKGTSGGASLSLADDACNWSWDATNGYYYIPGSTVRSFFYKNDGVFKNYAVSNLTNAAYAGVQVIVIDPANIVITSKVSAELAYNPASDEITEGDAWSAPTLVNPHTVAITSYNSDNEGVATVTDGGVIALAGGIGTAHITAHFAGDATYLEGDAVYTITVNEAGDDLSGTWTLASSVAAGDKIIIANVAVAGELLTMGAQNGSYREEVASTVDGENKLTPAAGTKVFTLVDASSFGSYEGFALQASNGNYLSSASNSSNNIKEVASVSDANAVWSIVISEGVAAIVAQGSYTRKVIRYNSGSTRFSCYAESNTMADVVIYKHGAAPEPVLDWVDGRTGLTPGNYYTICLPKKITHFRGATIWDLKKRNSEQTEVYLEEASLPFAAGTPFIIQATADKLEVVYEGAETGTPVESGALRGTLTGLDTDAFAALVGEIYILKDNAIRPRTAGNWLSANRAYIVYTDLIEVTEAPQGAPGKRVRAIPMQPKVATGMDALNASDKPVKMIINGQLFILRGEKLYDATGRLVK